MQIAALVPVLALVLAGCSALSVFDGPSRNHVSVANGAAFQVSLAEGEKRLVVALDTQSAMESRVIQTISVGRADAVPVSQYETAAKEWLRIERPDCRLGAGQGTTFGKMAFDVTCATQEPAAR